MWKYAWCTTNTEKWKPCHNNVNIIGKHPPLGPNTSPFVSIIKISDLCHRECQDTYSKGCNAKALTDFLWNVSVDMDLPAQITMKDKGHYIIRFINSISYNVQKIQYQIHPTGIKLIFHAKEETHPIPNFQQVILSRDCPHRDENRIKLLLHLKGLLPAARSQSFMVVSWEPVTTCGSWNDQKIHQQHRNYLNMAWHNLQNHRIKNTPTWFPFDQAHSSD